MNTPKVAIIILNWNGVDDTLALLKNLEAVTYDNFSVVIVDNASSDDSLGQIAKFMEGRRSQKQSYPISLLPLSKNFGFAQGNNKGVAQASREKPDYYLLLNNDTIVAPDFLIMLVEAADSNPQLAAVGPTIYFAEKNGQKRQELWYAGAWLNFYAGGAHHRTKLPGSKEVVVPTEFITGCCLLVKRSALAALQQLFDPAFFAYSEDVDLSIRLARAGYSLGYVPQSVIWHKLASSSGGPKSYNFWYYNIRNLWLLMGRYATWPQRLVFTGYFVFYKPVLTSLIGLIVRPRRDKIYRLIAIAHGALDAFRHRTGQRP